MNRNLTTRRPRRHPSPPPSLFGDNWGDFERLFDGFWTRSPAAEDAVAAFRPRVDVEETTDAYVITAELPGFAEDQVTATVSDGVLRLEAEASLDTGHDASEGEGQRRYHVRERSSGRFERAFRLPEVVDEKAIAARFENGVMTLTLPKTPVMEPEVRRIDIAKG